MPLWQDLRITQQLSDPEIAKRTQEATQSWSLWSEKQQRDTWKELYLDFGPSSKSVDQRKQDLKDANFGDEEWLEISTTATSFYVSFLHQLEARVIKTPSAPVAGVKLKGFR